ncbi:MAG: putative Ig domain-containing protein [Bryobacterales bacterium]|nr:putative Ig domain-containing protein [Bryobacterales bacterium]
MSSVDSPACSESGSEDYRKKLEKEQDHFRDLHDVHDLPPIFHYWAHTYIRPMAGEYGFTIAEELYARYLAKAADNGGDPSPVFLSIGSGNCDAEIRVARMLREYGVKRFTIECLDVNPAMLLRGHAQATEAGFAGFFRFTEADFNHWQADRQYTAVVANQALHHVVALETLFDEVKRSLRPGGYFVTSDMIGRNGHQRWPEALDAAQWFWRELPIEYRHNRVFDRYEEAYIDYDCSVEGFEGIRAQDILPLLLERFDFHLFVAFGNVVNVFLDRRFGVNFDAKADWDRGFIDRVHDFDEQAILRGEMTPTQMFAVMTAESCSEHHFSRGLTPQSCVRKAGSNPTAQYRGISIATSSLRPTTESGTRYRQQLEAVRGLSPYRWSARDLPPGFTLSPSGLLSGELRASGVFTLEIAVSDSSSPIRSGTQRYTVLVPDERIPLRFEITSHERLPSGTVGRPHSQLLAARGGKPPYAWRVADGMLPPGLQLDSRGLLSGAPAAAGVFPFTLSVEDSDSKTAASEIMLTIEPEGGPRRLVLPQIASGGSWKTQLNLINPSPSEASVRIVFRSHAGEPLTVPVNLTVRGGSPMAGAQGSGSRSEKLTAAEISETIPPWSSLHVGTPDEHAAAVVGWAEIIHPGQVTGYAAFEHFKSPGVPTDLLPALAPSFLLPFDNANGSQVGVALMNGDTSAPAAITLTIWDSAWVRIGSEAFDLLPGGHLSFMLAERHPATAAKRGVLEFRTAPDGRIGGLGLQFDASGRFVSIPKLTTSRS